MEKLETPPTVKKAYEMYRDDGYQFHTRADEFKKMRDNMTDFPWAVYWAHENMDCLPPHLKQGFCRKFQDYLVFMENNPDIAEYEHTEQRKYTKKMDWYRLTWGIFCSFVEIEEARIKTKVGKDLFHWNDLFEVPEGKIYKQY